MGFEQTRLALNRPLCLFGVRWSSSDDGQITVRALSAVSLDKGVVSSIVDFLARPFAGYNPNTTTPASFSRRSEIKSLERWIDYDLDSLCLVT